MKSEGSAAAAPVAEGRREGGNRGQDAHADAAFLAGLLAAGLGAGSPTRLEENAAPGEECRDAVVLVTGGTPEDAAARAVAALTAGAAAAVAAAAVAEAFDDALRAMQEAGEGGGMAIAWSGLLRARPGDLRRTAAVAVVEARSGGPAAELLRTGPRNLAFDCPGPPTGAIPHVAVVSFEVLGPTRNGGIGTACTSLAQMLASAGQDVHLIYTGDPVPEAAVAAWARRYADQGLRFEALDVKPAPLIASPHYNVRRAYEAYLRLKAIDAQRPLDVIHFPECQGHAYYVLQAKRHGLAFTRATIVVSVHSSTRWALEAGAQPPRWVGHLVDEFLERRCIERADVVMSPTAYLVAWMERNGIALPKRTYVQPYPLPREVRGAALNASASAEPGEPAANGAARRGPARELVFFGRLEPRKGLVDFCDALDELAAQPGPAVELVTFLGRDWWVGARPSSEYVSERAARWPWRVEVLGGRGHAEALEYIRGPGRLIVMPAPVDNSPNAVIEAIALGVDFLASRGGGTGELIDPADLERCTFDPIPGELDVEVGDAAAAALAARGGQLARRLRDALARTGRGPARFAVNPEANEREQIAWHERMAGRPASPTPDTLAGASVTVCVAGGPPGDETRAALAAQDHGDVEVLFEATRNVAAGRNALADRARGGWLLFADPANVAEPGAVSALLRAAQVADADLVVAPLARRKDPEEPPDCWEGWVPAGGPFAAGIFDNVFGRADFLISRDAFERLGGFAPDAHDAADWELLARASAAGLAIEVYPEPLCEREAPADFHTRMMGPEEHGVSALVGSHRTLDPYLEHLGGPMRDLPVVARELFWHALTPVREDAALRHQVSDLEIWKQVYEESLSWRVTRPLRWAGEAVRRVRGGGPRPGGEP